MTTNELPRPDRWLVVPNSLFDQLSAQAASDDALMHLRFASRHVEPVSTELLRDRALALLDGDWDKVRLVFSTEDAATKSQIYRALDDLSESCTNEQLARIRLHNHVIDPAGTQASLNAPDEAILTRWLASGRTGEPLLHSRDVTPEWVTSYLAAFDVWHRSVMYHQGEDAFDWYDEAAAGESAPDLQLQLPSPVALEWLSIEPANNARLRAQGGLWGKADRLLGGSPADDSGLLLREVSEAARFRVELTIKAQSDDAEPVMVTLTAPAAAREAQPLHGLRLVSSPDDASPGAVLAEVQLSWNDTLFNGQAYASGILLNADGGLPGLLRTRLWLAKLY